MRLRFCLPLFACFLLHACDGASGDADTLEGASGEKWAPVAPALVDVDPEYTGDTTANDSNTPTDGSAPKRKILRNIFKGSVDGTTLQPTYSFFLQGVMTVGDAQPTLVFVQTDAANLCEHMQRGTMPKNTTILASALVQTDGQPVQVGYSYTAPGHHGMDEDPRSIAFFRRVDSTCEVSPNEVGAQAMYGQAMIRKLVPGQEVVVDYAFDFEEAGSITGHVEAPFCDAPGFFVNPEQFYQPIEPEDCLDQ